jgi:lauroyl/myristoyl acyltransferase
MISRVVVDGCYYRSIRCMPRHADLFGRQVARLIWAASGSTRAVLSENARLALGPDASPKRVQEVAREIICNMQRSITEVLLSEGASADELASSVREFSGEKEYDRARALKKGMLLASIHMGAFEPCMALLRRFERRVHVLFHPDPMPSFERARSRLRRSLGVIEHAVSDGVSAWVALRDALEADEVVVLHADRVMPGQSGARMRFLGIDDANLPTGPARLAIGCGTPIVPTFCVRRPGGYAVHMSTPIIAPAQALRANDVANHPSQRALIAAMETAIRAAPDQWMAYGRIAGAHR